jgi:hypothetical protein
MSISLAVGTEKIEANNLKDLKSSVDTLMGIAHPLFANGLDQPVSKFPSNTGPVAVNYTSGNGSWTAGNFTFGLCGGVGGAVGILGQGQNLQTYTKTFPTTIGDDLGGETNAASAGTIAVGAGEFYLQLSLDMTITASAAATVTLGSVGITGSVGNGDSFTVSFYKKVDGATLLRDALQAAFEGFVLPMHSGTYAGLQPGDYLYHQFNATLNLGFGATLGVDKVLYAGQYQADIPKAPSLPAVSTSVVAEVQAGATFGASFNYTGSYEAMLWKTDDGTGRLHLYRNKVTDANFNVGVAVAVIAAPTVTVSPADLSSLTSKVLPGGTGNVVNKLLVGAAQGEVNKWVNDVQTKITGWLSPFQQGATALQLAIDSTTSKFLLLDFTFELGAAGFATAWSQAVAGNYCAALAVPNGGVSLDTGSGLENFHTVKTSVTFNLFGAFTAEWDAAKINNYSVQYAGNNTFHLVEDIGRAQISTVGKSGTEVELYFAATATSGPAGTTVGEVDLHVLLTATRNAGFGAEIAGVLSNATTGMVASTLNKQMLALAQQGNATETLEMIFKPSAYGRLSSSTLGGGKILNEGVDQGNFNAFAEACSHVEGSEPANFTMSPEMDYATWRVWNIAANDQFPPPAGSSPNRRNAGNIAAGVSYLGQQFGASAPAQLVGFAFQAASDFMNFCEDLKGLAALVAANTAWNTLIADLQSIVKNDVAGDFIPATALALASCLGQAGMQPQMSGPAPNGGREPSITVTLVYS